MKPFRDVIVANLLMYYDDMKAVLGNDSLIINKMQRSAAAVDVSLWQLSEWGNEIRKQWQVENTHNFARMDATEVERLTKNLEIEQKIAVEQLEVNKRQERRLESVEKKWVRF